jgi:hypothetical protein
VDEDHAVDSGVMSALGQHKGRDLLHALRDAQILQVRKDKTLTKTPS